VAFLALSDPIIRLVYQRGEFNAHETQIVATALFWFAFSLPTNGVYLLQTRTFFSLQRPWQATGLAVIDLVVSAAAAAVLYKPFGIGGIVAGTGIGTSTAVFAQAFILRRKFGGLELGRLLSTTIRISIASAALAAVGWLIWDGLDSALGRSTVAQIISLGTGMIVGAVVYLGVARLLRIAELEQILRLLRRRSA
jgi:putative peptidoglycan lipid II flippase